ncbi:MAG: hypothetical protein OXH23_01955 [bacterium]|nr:hypothetical protein [bacterium]
MDIVLTGTGSPLPDANRAGPSILVKASDTHILVGAKRLVLTHMVPAPPPSSIRNGSNWLPSTTKARSSSGTT